MAKIIITKDNSIEQFKDGFNSLSLGVGDLSDLSLLPDSDLVQAIIRLDSTTAIEGNAITLGGELPAHYLAWANITSKPSTDGIPENSGFKYYTKTRTDSDIDLRVTKAFIDAKGINAVELQGVDAAHLLDFGNQTNTTNALTTAMLQSQSVSLEKLKHPSPATGARFMAWSGSAWVTVDRATMQSGTYLNFENGATADQSASEISTLYNSVNFQVSESEITAGIQVIPTRRWSPADVADAARHHAPRAIPVWQANYTGVTAGFTIEPAALETANNSLRYLCNTSGGVFNITLPAAPAVGTLLGFVDLNGTFDINPVTLLHNGLKIFGVVDNLVLDKSRLSVVLEYTGTAQGWVII